MDFEFEFEGKTYSITTTGDSESERPHHVALPDGTHVQIGWLKSGDNPWEVSKVEKITVAKATEVTPV